jgi:hypothetical protein
MMLQRILSKQNVDLCTRFNRFRIRSSGGGFVNSDESSVTIKAGNFWIGYITMNCSRNCLLSGVEDKCHQMRNCTLNMTEN